MDVSTGLLSLVVLSVLVGLVTSRVARLISTDSISDRLLENLQLYLLRMPNDDLRDSGFRYWAAYLIGCEFCVGIWVAFGVTSLSLFFFTPNHWLEMVYVWLAASAIQVYMIPRQA